jgi:hypothetical protein
MGGAAGAPGGAAAPSPNLPVVWIDVRGQGIPRDNKIMGRVKIITEHDGRHQDLAGRPAALESPMGISIRGSGSASAPQPGYALELRDAAGADVKLPVLGMPAESDWALIACWLDKPCLRNAVAYAIGQQMGRWAPRFRFVEVFVDGGYRGLYFLAEAIRAGKNRVPIDRPAEDAARGTVTGGYIFSKEANGKGGPSSNPPRDWISATKEDGPWPHQQVYTFRYPKYRDITAAQRAYIADHMARFEAMMKGAAWSDAARGYPAWIDVTSFADYAIMSELANNSDSYGRSVYFIKLVDPMPGVLGKILASPLWDYNFAFGFPTFRAGYKVDVWNWQNDMTYGGNCTDWLPRGAPLCDAGCCTSACRAPAKCWNMPWSIWWFKKLWGEARFQNALKCRWQELRKGPISMKFIDDNLQQWKAALMPLAYPRHFARWPEFRRSIDKRPCMADGAGKLVAGQYVVPGVPNPNCGDPTAPVADMVDYEITWMRAWLEARIAWLDKNLPGVCSG